jgi:hypothetical protein
MHTTMTVSAAAGSDNNLSKPAATPVPQEHRINSNDGHEFHHIVDKSAATACSSIEALCHRVNSSCILLQSTALYSHHAFVTCIDDAIYIELLQHAYKSRL